VPMLSFLRNLFSPTAAVLPEGIVEVDAPGDGVVRVDDYVLYLQRHADVHEGLPHPHWPEVHAWIDQLPQSRRAEVWCACERTWVLWLRTALGDGYRLFESPHVLLLTAQEQRPAVVTLHYVVATFRRVQRVLEELAQPADAGKEIVIVFSDEDSYYRYVSYFNAEGGEYAMSSGMHIGGGCGHFVTYDVEELHRMEPVIAHEMTHSLLGHLPIPAWLNEGLAVNTEWHLAHNATHAWDLQELEAEHRDFWTPDLIQEFWCGRSYERPDAGNKLSYDLGRILVTALSTDWSAFKRFAAAAKGADGGAAAAHDVLNVDLGEFVRQFLQREDGTWGPDPRRWQQAPERGGFSVVRS
jgi:hypothetical protein